MPEQELFRAAQIHKIQESAWPDQVIDANKDLWLRDPRAWDENPPFCPDSLVECIEKLKFVFGKYSVSDFFWMPGSLELAREFIHLAQGMSIFEWANRGKGKEMNFPITGRMETHHFRHLEMTGHNTTNLGKAIYLAQILHADGNPGIAEKLVQVDRWMPYDSLERIKFYRDMTRWMVRHNVHVDDVVPLGDFFRDILQADFEIPLPGAHPFFTRVLSFEPWDFTIFEKMTLPTALRVMDEWHLGLSKNPLPETTWPEKYKLWIQGPWEIEEITTTRGLQAEGTELRHCVATYFPSIQEGKVRVLSIKSPHGVRRLTMEVKVATFTDLFSPFNPFGSSSVVQVRGYRNRLANAEEQEVVKAWARDNDCLVSLQGLGF